MTTRRPGTYLLILAAIAAVVWGLAAIEPVSRSTWALENILLFVGVAWLISTYAAWPLSNISYTLVFVFLVLHVIGSHYTYSLVPYGDWLQLIFGQERNAYDRLLHLLFGFLLFLPWRETCERALGLRRSQAGVVAVLIISSISAAYEIMEWVAAEFVDPSDAMGYIGAQGDFFDAQKDMALAIMGAVAALAIDVAVKTGRHESPGDFPRAHPPA